MIINVRIPGGVIHDIKATCITEALRTFYRRGRYTSAIQLEAKWPTWKCWASYRVGAEITVEQLGPV